MTNTEILTKAIQKAIDGGWEGLLRNGGSNKTGCYHYPDGTQLLKWRWEEKERVFSDGEYDGYESINVEAIIFNHDFAKALWGEKWLPITEGVQDGGQYTDFRHQRTHDWQEMLFSTWDYVMPAWAYHLCQMVIAEDPIKYLGEHLGG